MKLQQHSLQIYFLQITFSISTRLQLHSLKTKDGNWHEYNRLDQI